MATPMTGPVLVRNDSRGRGRRWIYLSILGALGLSWSVHDHPPGSNRSLGSSPAATEPGRVAESSGRVDESPCPAAESPDRSDPARLVALKPPAEVPTVRALRMIEECQARYDAVRDYICTFTKRERLNGHLNPVHVMTMKVRTRPRSVYLKFRQPRHRAGREAIYIDGHNDGKVLAHDVGLGRLIAGTLCLDPDGARAMEDNRHPITHAGIGPLLETLEDRWSKELDPSESLIEFQDGLNVGPRPCAMIESTHPRELPHFMFYRVRVYIDREIGLPIRFEAFDWPDSPGAEPELVEEYTYTDLKLNVGLGDVDFDASNADYAFGRF